METRGVTAVFGVCTALIAMLLNFAIPRFQGNIEQMKWSMMQPPGGASSQMMETISTIRSAILGTDVIGAGGREAATAMAWSHPVFFALIFAHGITLFTRVPAGEVDKGTMDVLLGLPVSRWQVFLSESIVSLVSGVLVIGMGLLGSRIGNSFAPAGMTPDLWRMGMVSVNLLFLYAVVAAVGSLCAGICDRRMRAVGAVLVFVVGSLMLNVLGPFWEPARDFKFLSMLDYYRPIRGPLVNGVWLWGDLAVLGISAVVVWTAAGVWFSRRDLSTT